MSAAEKMTPRFDLKRQTRRRLVLLRCCVRCFWSRMIACSLGNKPVVNYRVLQTAALAPPPPPQPQPSPIQTGVVEASPEIDSDLVPLKISLLGDPRIGKTSFMTKYVGNEREQDLVQGEGFNLIDKTFSVKGATISYSIWEVDGDKNTTDHIPVACKDSVAILFMFDLTSRCTLNSVLNWYQQARKYNQSAIPVLVGTKFDDFIQLPMDLQWTIASEARAIAKALNATLFFSSAAYNINVNKIFKFITARLFDLPWTVERNLTIGEPIIDF